jgi:cytochrome o ubiquinol oxidase operon protein cyoD
MIKSYIIGFILSVLITSLAFYLAFLHVASGHITFSHQFLTAALLSLGILQFVVQSIFFLHLINKSSRWNLVVFASTVSIVLVIVVGSIWIMNHLNYNMTSHEVDDYMQKTELIYK